MHRSGKVFMHDTYAGIVLQSEDGYTFTYAKEYLNSENPIPISLTLPLRTESFHSNTMLPFFDGLIPEGWLLNIAVKNWKLNSKDRMGLLLNLCNDCIGAVSIIQIEETDG